MFPFFIINDIEISSNESPFQILPNLRQAGKPPSMPGMQSYVLLWP
jgi:hypothetical protein